MQLPKQSPGTYKILHTAMCLISKRLLNDHSTKRHGTLEVMCHFFAPSPILALRAKSHLAALALPYRTRHLF